MIIAIPITLLLIYLPKYYTLKHEYDYLAEAYKILSIKHTQAINTILGEQNEEE